MVGCAGRLAAFGWGELTPDVICNDRFGGAWPKAPRTDAKGRRQLGLSTVAWLPADRKKALSTEEERRTDVGGHGGRSYALRATRNFVLLRSSVVLNPPLCWKTCGAIPEQALPGDR